MGGGDIYPYMPVLDEERKVIDELAAVIREGQVKHVKEKRVPAGVAS